MTTTKNIILNQRRTNRNESEYKLLLLKVLQNGLSVADRTGIGTVMMSNQVLELDMANLPIMTGKKVFWKTAVKEWQLFLKGETDNAEFEKVGIKYWTPFADKDNKLGPVYGSQWTNFNGDGINQVKTVIDSIKNDPQSRRHVISAWNPSKLAVMALPPCPMTYQFTVNGDKLDMLVHQRSGDLFLGIPFDIFQDYLLATIVNQGKYKLGKLTIIIGNAHIYQNHLEQVEEYLLRPVFKAPTADIKYTADGKLKEVSLHEYHCGEYIKGALNA